MTEQALAQAWLERRDPDAFQGLCEKHGGMVYATALRMLRNSADAEDITQECFLRLARSSASIHGSLGAWLHRVAVNLAIDHVRRNSARNAREETFAGLSPATTEVTWNDLREHVDAAINELPEHVRDTVIAHFIEGIPQQQLAEAEGVTRSAISQRINRALQLVRVSLEKRGVTVSLAALTSMLAANLSEAVAVPAGLAANLGNLAVYAGATQAGVGVASGLLTGKAIIAAILALLTLGGAGVVVLRSHNAERTETAAMPPQDPEYPAVDAAPETSSAPALETANRNAAPTSLVESAAVALAGDTGASVEGFVREQDTGRPLQGVYLVCQPDDGSGTFQYSDDERVFTGEEGRYRITGLAPGRYKLLCADSWRTRDPGDPQDYEVQLRFVRNASVRRFEVAETSTQAGPDFEAIVGETISGVVVLDGKPVADAVVMAHGTGTFVNARTTANGWFKAGGFPITDEVHVIAEKGRTKPGIRIEATGSQEEISPEPQTLTSDIAGPLTMVDGGLKNVRLALQPGASVSGVLTDRQGQPIAGVNVMARSTARKFFGSRFAKTGDQGDFTLSGLSEGEFDLAWNPQKPGEDEHTYGWSPHEALVLKRIEVTWDQHIDGVHLRAADATTASSGSEAGWILTGRIRDARGNVVENASVRGWEIGKSGDSPTTTSESNGGFQLSGLRAGPLTMLRVEHPDYSAYMQSLPEPAERPLDIVLEDRGIVSGQVRYADTGMPVTSFYIRMQKGNNQPTLVENEEGRFRFEGADAGKNEILVSAEGYKETSTPVTVLPGREVAGVNARLERGLAVEGTVVDERGAPVEGAFLFAKRVPTAATERETQTLAKTDANGKFRIETLDKDFGSVAAWHAEFGMGASLYDAASPNAEIVLRNNMGTVIGRVLADGNAAAGAQVSLMGSELLSAETAAFGSPNRRALDDGTFRFEDVPEGEYNVSATIGDRNAISPMGGKNLSRTILVERGAETEVVIEFPAEDASLEGRVMVRGEPVSQGFVILTLESPEGKQTHMAQVGEDGSYLIGPVAAGRATLRTSVVTEAPFASMSQKLEFEIAPGEAVVRDIEFNGRGTVRGTVTGVPAERQLPIALIPASFDLGIVTLETVLAASQETVANAMVTGPGQFSFSGVPPGEYTVFAWLSNPSGRVEGYGTAYCIVQDDGASAAVSLRIQMQ